MLETDFLTTVKAFVNQEYACPWVDPSITHVMTMYAIQYDGTTESEQDIAMFIGGFVYGRLTICDSWLTSQHIQTARDIASSIQDIHIGDWVCLNAGKHFLVRKDDMDDLVVGWNMSPTIFNNKFFKQYNGSPIAYLREHKRKKAV